MLIQDANQLVEVEADEYRRGQLSDFYLKSASDERKIGFGKHLLLLSLTGSENYLRTELIKKSFSKNSNMIIEFETFPFELLQIFGDYIYRKCATQLTYSHINLHFYILNFKAYSRIARIYSIGELVQFYDFCHFLGMERICCDVISELCRVIVLDFKLLAVKFW